MRALRLLAAASVLGLTCATLGMATATAAGATTHHLTTVARPSRTSSTAGRPDVGGFVIFNYRLDSSGNPLCLGTNGTSNGSAAVLVKCGGSKDETWHWGGDNDTWAQLENNNNQCLAVQGGSTKEGARVVGWKCLSGSKHKDQYWYTNPKYTCSEGSYYTFQPFFNEKSGYVLGVVGTPARGARTDIWKFQNKCNNQFWA
jgi:hypothetical protein